MNEAVTGSFGKEKDVDCYTFTLDGDMVIQPKLTFDPLETSAKTYVLSILNGTEILHTAKISGKESGKVIAPLALKAGTYTAKLENPSFALQDYTLTIAAVQADLAEAEPNDTLAKGTRMELNQKITGVLTTEEDVDIYKLVLSEETTACVSFEFPEGIISGQTYTIILEQGGKKLWSATVSGESPKLGQNLQIPSGEYYLRVKPVNWCSAVYQIAVSEL